MVNIHIIDNHSGIKKAFQSIENQSQLEFIDYGMHLDKPFSEMADHLKEALERLNQYNQDIIAININLVYTEKILREDGGKPITKKIPRQKMMGIEILKYLRLAGIENHVLLYSFLDIETLLRLNSYNTIILSEGTSFLRLPNSISSAKWEKMLKEKCKEDMTKYIRGEFILPEQNRHYWANWFGVVRLWEVHKAIDPTFQDEYPQAIKEQINRLESRQALKLHGHDPKKLQESFIQTEEMVQEKLRQAEEELTHIEGQLEKINNSIVEMDDFGEELMGLKKFPNMKGIIELYLEHYSSVVQKIEKEADEKYLKTKEDEQKNIKIIETTKQELTKIKEFHENKFKGIKELRRILINGKPKILLIDDQIGWSQVFSQIIYGKNDPEAFQFIPVEKFKEIEGISDDKEQKEALSNLYCDTIKPLIEKHQTQLIILDLRLINEKGSFLNVDELSGVYILNKLREDYKSIPILISTSSNKYYYYEKLTEFGKANAFWNKEGLDDNRTEQDSIENYCRFIDIIVKLTGKEYGLLYQFGKAIEKIKGKEERHWWESKKWMNKDLTKVDKRTVYKMLESGLSMYQNHLKSFVLNIQYEDQFYKNESLSALINRLNCIIEHVHEMDKKKWEGSKRKTLSEFKEKSYEKKKDFLSNGDVLGGIYYNRKWNKSRGDYIGQYLYNIRNPISHNHNFNISFQDLRLYINTLLFWLDNWKQLDGPGLLKNKTNSDWESAKNKLKKLILDNKERLPNYLQKCAM